MKGACFVVPLIALLWIPILPPKLSEAAQPPRPGSAEERFRQFDKNGDGKITREESGDATWFETLDFNRDGVVTVEEARAAAASKSQVSEEGSASLRP